MENEEYEQEEEKKKRKYILLILLLLLLLFIFIIIIYFWYGKIKLTSCLGKKDNENIIFNNNIGTIENNTITYGDTTTSDSSQTGEENTEETNAERKNINKTTNTEENSENETEIEKIFAVTSNNKKWTETLEIFNNEEYNGQTIIYPGIENTYYFEITNTTDTDITCRLKFKETNLENLPIKYKLKENGVYVKGSKTEYVTYDKLNLKNISIQSGNQNVYALEWKWVDDDNTSSNYYGDISKNITYTLQITVQAEI